MTKRWAWLVLIALIVAGCQAEPPPPPPIGTVTRPDLVGLIDWERSPQAVVFRAEISSTDTTSFERRNDIADCTIFGNNVLIYTAPNGLGTTVVWDQLTDEAIRLFIEDLTVRYMIYNYGASLDALPEDQRPPLTETLLLVVNGLAHHTDAYSGWPSGFYRDVTERCRAMVVTPNALIPAGGYVSVDLVEYDTERPSIMWESVAHLDLSTLPPGERVWMTDSAMQDLWRLLRDYGAGIQIQQDEATFRAAVEVPGVTRYAPPPQ